MSSAEETRGSKLQQQQAQLEPRHPPPNEALNADGAVDVTVRAHVMSLSSIDSREQRFEALVWLQVRGRSSWGRCGALHAEGPCFRSLTGSCAFRWRLRRRRRGGRS